MSHKKRNKSTANKQEITYADIKITKSQQKQRITKRQQSPSIEREEQLIYTELKCHRRTSQVQHRKWAETGNRKDSRLTVWKVVTGILGVLCMVLMMTVGILFLKLFSSQEDQTREQSLHSLPCPKNNDVSCDLCSYDWIALGNSYYHSFNETKTWEESWTACAELGSHLVKIDTEGELENLALFEINGWILVEMNKTSSSWLWKNGTKAQFTLPNDPKKKSHSCPYTSGNHIYSDNCSSRKPYTCEFNIHKHPFN